MRAPANHAIVTPAIWNPAGNSWVEAGTKFGTSPPTKLTNSNEETWTLLPDGSVLTVETFPTAAQPNDAQEYVLSLDAWVSVASTPQQLPLTTIKDLTTGATVEVYEIGPALLLPSGHVFAIGGGGHTAIYMMPDKDPDLELRTRTVEHRQVSVNASDSSDRGQCARWDLNPGPSA